MSEGDLPPDEPSPGIGLRDYFADVMLHALVAKVVFDKPAEEMLMKAGLKTAEFDAYTAHLAYEFADATLHERGRK